MKMFCLSANYLLVSSEFKLTKNRTELCGRRAPNEHSVARCTTTMKRGCTIALPAGSRSSPRMPSSSRAPGGLASTTQLKQNLLFSTLDDLLKRLRLLLVRHAAA